MIKPNTDRQDADAVLTRHFDLSDGRPVDIHLWRPEVEDDGRTWRCDWKITGLLGDKMRFSCGVDSYQAFVLALQAVGSHIYTEGAWEDGRLTYLGGRDLGLLSLPGDRPMEGGYARAELLSLPGWEAVVRVDDVPMPYLAWSDEALASQIRNLEAVLKDVETSPDAARTLLTRIIDNLLEEKHYYEAVCRGAGLPPPPVEQGK
jgi:hypothetical protein